MDPHNMGCAPIYLTREEAVILLGAIAMGSKHLTEYLNHEMFDSNHAEATRVAIQVLTSVGEELVSITGDSHIRNSRIIR